MQLTERYSVAPELSDHILNFLEQFRSLGALRRAAIPLIASSLLLDHYTPDMHLFDCHHVFRELYESACLEAVSQFKQNFGGLILPLEIDGIDIPGYNVQRSFDVKVGTSSGALSVVCLGILGWNVDDCLSHLRTFAQESFVHGQSKPVQLLSSIPFVSSIVGLFQLIRSLLSDSKYDADGIEQLLIDTYGFDRSCIDISSAAELGGYVGVTLTKTNDGSVFLATNSNGTDMRHSNSDYRHIDSHDGQDEVKWWQILRCATAAPYYYEAKCLGGLGTFQDGGIAVNNPVCIAVHEATRHSPDMAEPSIVVSLGTGCAPDSNVESSSFLSARFPSRLWRALWKQTSSKTTWDRFLSNQGPGSKTQNFRFDVSFMEKEPVLDQVGDVDYVQRAARNAIRKSLDVRRLCHHLRAELFLFELDEEHPPYFAHGAYQCSGRIICRLRAQTVEYEGFLRQLCKREAFFRLGTQNLAVKYENIEKDLCYEVRFAVPSLSGDIPITLNETLEEEYHINGSPFTLDWLVRRQELDASFGTSNHRLRNPSTFYMPRTK
ncbi:uncharacterized protein FIESC28_00660 [Fusarium coffeatum]|uniref:PNPLA domain-containing protein n=1 Tax=Fusarium coffeatum TaxID=231269 RepID=A0A366SB27_9HYPO|nr:uncharacterized protein FIESC28_00660 [Fusarium coffeatum]RBR26543.1 hypothetical protein FIESC28_00660 [Fusarium coffeatum]